MRDDLFFIAMISAALDQPDRSASLREVFEQIRRMGRLRRYRQGYRQFIHWMQEVATARRVVESIRAQTEAPDALDRPILIELLIERDETLVAGVRLDPRGTSVVRAIAPGSYRLRLDTGLTLWEGVISEHGEFAARPEPGQPLRMAAATARPLASRTEIRLLNGEIVLHIRREAAGWSLEIHSASPEA